jgi:triphosphoribosyl-dephospho-CoA synthase
MLCAAAGRARAQGTPLSPSALRAAMLIRWGEELAGHAGTVSAPSNGLRVAARYAVSGARGRRAGIAVGV